MTKIDCFWWIHYVSRHSHFTSFPDAPIHIVLYDWWLYIPYMSISYVFPGNVILFPIIGASTPPVSHEPNYLCIYRSHINIYIYIYILCIIYIAIILLCPWHILIFPMIANSIVLLLVVFVWTNLHLSQRRSRCFSLLQDWCCCRCFGGGWGALCSPREILKFMKCMCMCLLYI